MDLPGKEALTLQKVASPIGTGWPAAQGGPETIGLLPALCAAPAPLLLMQVLVDLLRREALKTNELLRHFWRAVPATTQARGAKAGKLAGHLAEQQRVLGSHMAANPGTTDQVGWAALGWAGGGGLWMRWWEHGRWWSSCGCWAATWRPGRGIVAEVGGGGMMRGGR